MPTTAPSVGERHSGVQGLAARSPGRPARHHRGPGSAVVTRAKKREYGTGRARLPGLEEMMAAMQAEGSGAAPSSGSGSGSSGPARPPARPNSGSSSGQKAAAPSPSSGGGSTGEDAPSLGDYLKFGRLLGDKPQQVQQQLALGATRVVVDDQSAGYLQSWEEEEAEAYAMFEAVLQRQAARPAGAAAGAAAKKLERNKARVSAAASAMQIERQARRERDSAGAPLSAAQRKLARNKALGGGMGASMRASLEELMGTAGLEGDADDAFELVSRPTPPGAMAKPARPSAAAYEGGDSEDEYEDDLSLDEEEAEYAEWAAEAEAEFGSLEDAYQDFEARLGRPSAPAPTPSKPKRSGMAQGGMAAPQRPRGAAAQPPAPPAGRVQLQLSQFARPPKLAAKPQASQEAREAAQRPLPPPPPPEPKLASKPSRPSAPAPAAPARPAAPAAAAAPQPPPQLAAKPAVKPAAAEPRKRAPAPEAAAVSKPVPAAVPPAAAPQPAAAKAAKAEQQVAAHPAQAAAAKPAAAPTAPAAAAAELAAAPEAPAAAPAVEQQKASAPAAPAGPAKPKRQPVAAEAPAKPAAAPPAKPAAAAAPAVEPKPQRPAPSPLRQMKEQRLAEERERKAAQAARRAAMAQEFKERRESNAAYGQDRLLDRQAETLTVWQINSAGVLVRNQNLSGFIPSSLLSPLNVAAVIEAERPLLAAAAAGAIVAQLETEGQPAQAADGADLDPATRAAARRQALEEVLLGRQLTAQVVNVDAASGRVVLSERAAVSAWKERGVRATPPSSAELQAAAGMLGELVDATVVHVKPFGAFLEFQAELPTFMGGAAGGGSERAALVGLVHRSEVSWDPEVSIADALQVGQQVKAKLLHVDAAKARIFLSIRRITANPLLETLDSLVTSAAAAASAGGSSSSSSSSAGAGSGGGAAGVGSEGAPAAAAPAAPLDERPLLGDLPEAVRFCELMVEGGRGAVLSATPGVRLQSRAASQELEVYLAKDASAGIGAAVAAVGGTAEPAAAAAAPGPPDAATFNLVLRCARTVQEVAVRATCSREEARQLIAASISQLAAEVEAAAEDGA